MAGTKTRGASEGAMALAQLLELAQQQAKAGQHDRGPMDYTVEHSGRKITLPADPTPLPLLDAAEILTQMHEESHQEVAISESIRGAHYVDGLVAFTGAMEEVFGWTRAVNIPGFFGDTPPVYVDVPTGVGQTTRVLTGRFTMPNVKGWVQTSSDQEKGVTVFRIVGKTIRQFQPLFEELAEVTRRRVLENSIFKNKAFELQFEDGRVSDEPPRFIDVSGAETPIFSRETERAVQANILTPIQHSQRCRDMRIPLKRGVLLEGPYGTGKTLVSRQAAQEALKHGWTHITIREPQNLAPTLEFARKFQPCVVFVEDIDREMEGEDRTQRIDNILNTLDGVDSKNSEVMVVFTSNHAENINRAMMRPGRLDAVISVQNPDAAAAQRLAQVYGGKMLDPNADYSLAGEALAGQSPAVIREIVERAKLFAMGDVGPDEAFVLSPQALIDSGETMQRQLALLEPKVEEPDTIGEAFIQRIVNDVITGIGGTVLADNAISAKTADKTLGLTTKLAKSAGLV